MIPPVSVHLEDTPGLFCTDPVYIFSLHHISAEDCPVRPARLHPGRQLIDHLVLTCCTIFMHHFPSVMDEAAHTLTPGVITHSRDPSCCIMSPPVFVIRPTFHVRHDYWAVLGVRHHWGGPRLTGEETRCGKGVLKKQRGASSEHERAQ